MIEHLPQFLFPRTPKAILLFLLYVVFLFVIFTNYLDKRWQKYYEKTVEIRRTDSVNLKVINTLRNRNYLYFNDSLYIVSYKIELPNLRFLDIDKLELPFYLKKNADNDTLWIIDNKETYFGVFRKDRDVDCR